MCRRRILIAMQTQFGEKLKFWWRIMSLHLKIHYAAELFALHCVCDIFVAVGNYAAARRGVINRRLCRNNYRQLHLARSWEYFPRPSLSRRSIPLKGLSSPCVQRRPQNKTSSCKLLFFLSLTLVFPLRHLAFEFDPQQHFGVAADNTLTNAPLS